MAPTDYFTLLSLPKDFDLGLKKLDVAYFSLQTKLHPDRFANKSTKEQMFSMQQSVNLNMAYATLKSTLLRAEYMLKLEGIIVNDANATIKPSQQILLESMEMREHLAQTNSAGAIRQVIIETMDNILLVIEAIKKDFIDGKLEEAAQNTIKLRYLEKLSEEALLKSKSV